MASIFRLLVAKNISIIGKPDSRSPFDIMVKCNQCGATWAMGFDIMTAPTAEGYKKPSKGFWRCSNGCNIKTNRHPLQTG